MSFCSSITVANPCRLPQPGARFMDPKKVMMREFWGAHMRFFRSMCTASKVTEVVRQARAALAAGECVVIGLQSTGKPPGSAFSGLFCCFWSS